MEGTSLLILNLHSTVVLYLNPLTEVLAYLQLCIASRFCWAGMFSAIFTLHNPETVN